MIAAIASWGDLLPLLAYPLAIGLLVYACGDEDQCGRARVFVRFVVACVLVFAVVLAWIQVHHLTERLAAVEAAVAP